MAKMGKAGKTFLHTATEEEFRKAESGDLRVILVKGEPEYNVGDDIVLTRRERLLLCEVTDIIKEEEGLRKGYSMVLFERPFRSYTKKEVDENRKKYCEKCKYRGTMGGGQSAGTICNYLYLTKHRRKCSPIECRKFVKGPMTKENQTTKHLAARY